MEQFTLHIAPTVSVVLQLSAIHFHQKTKFQEIVVAESDYLGKFLMIDNVIQFTSRDHRIYSEMITHPAVCRAQNLNEALVIGGGDLLVAAELLKYGVRTTVVDIDPVVTEVTLRYFGDLIPNIVGQNSKVEIVHADGHQYVQQLNGKVDVIIVDSTDFNPHTPAVSLFSSEFYFLCASRLSEGGVMTTQNGIPFLSRKSFERAQYNLSRSFRSVVPYEFSVPSYFGGSTVCTISSNNCISEHLNRLPIDLVFANDRKIRYLSHYLMEDPVMRTRRRV